MSRRPYQDAPLPADMLDALVADLEPVTPLRSREGLFLTALLLAWLLLLVVLGLAPGHDLAAGFLEPTFILRSGTLLLLGGAAAVAAVATARPGIGDGAGGVRHGWLAALAMAGLFPLAALASSIADPAAARASILRPSAIECLGVSLTLALGVAGVLVFWLRRGAPVSLERAGWVVGIAAGALGGFAFSLRCPYTEVAYIGTWFTLVVAIAAVAGRLAVPRLIRW